jgi:hypothetical protein
MKPTLLLLVFVAGAFARLQVPVRGRPRGAPETAVIRGRVMAAGSDLGVRKARVSLTPEMGAPHDPIYTDDEGRFEFSGVTPGRYAVAAWKSGWVETKFGARSFWDRHVSIVAAANAVIEDVQLTLEKGAAVSGRVLDEEGAPLSGMSVGVGRAVMQDGRLRFVSAGETDTDDLGEYRVGGLPAGTFFVSVFGFPPPPAPSTRLAGPGAGMFDPQRPHTVYYPQSTSLTQATPIPLRAGDDAGAIDVVFTSTGSSAQVSGRIVDPRARSTIFSLAVLSDGNGVSSAMMGMNMGVPQSGEFSVPVAPGEYTIVAQSDNGAAMQRVTVGQEGIGGIQLVIANHARVSGRVVFEGASPRPAARLVVEAWSSDVLPGLMGIRAGAEQDGQPARVDANGRFTLTGVFGRRELRLNQLPPGWIVKSITTGGRDVLDVPIDFKGGEDLRDVVITVTDRSAALTGTVVDASGGPSSGLSVLLFADDPRQLPRRARWEKPDLLGRFVMSGLPAGTYLIALVADVDDSRWSTAEYLDGFRGQAIRLTLADGETKAIALQWSDPR